MYTLYWKKFKYLKVLNLLSAGLRTFKSKWLPPTCKDFLLGVHFLVLFVGVL